jgi:hypothetical protein
MEALQFGSIEDELMSDSSNPGWTKPQLEKPGSRAQAQLIERGAPRFWNELQEKLNAAVDSLYLQDLSGLITSFGGGLRVTLNRPGKVFNQDYTDIQFKRAPAEIRCTTLKDGTYSLRFSVTGNNELVVISSRGLDPMTPEQASEYIMNLLVAASGRQ